MRCPLNLRASDTIPGRLLLALEGTALQTAVVEIWALDDTAVDRGASMPEPLSQAEKGAREFYLVASGLIVTVGELVAYPGYVAAIPATVATLLGVGGTFPTLFAGGETLIMEIDNQPFTTNFVVGDQSAAQVAAAINAAAFAAGIPGTPATVQGGEIQIAGNVTGSAGEVVVTGGTGAATLGLSGFALGTDGVPGRQQADNMPEPGTVYVRVTTAPAAASVLKVACGK
jgi:hypothetical protein